MYFRTGRHAPSELQKTSCEYDKSGEFSEYKCTLFQTHFIRIQYALAPQPTGRHAMLNILLLFCEFRNTINVKAFW